MIDEHFDRHYQAARGQVNADIAANLRHLGALVGESFRVLHRIEWSAPWAESRKRARRA